jgi:hypothetical protein
MDGLTLLRRAQDAGLRLQAAGSALKITGPKEAEPLVRLLAEHKVQVLDALQVANGEQQKMQEMQKIGSEGSQGDLLLQAAGSYDTVMAALRSRCPDYVPGDRWEQAVQDADAFLATWGALARALGWTTHELFGLHPVPEPPAANYSRLSRYDYTGLIWLLQGLAVVALTETQAAILGRSGATLTYRKHNKPALGPLGDCLDDMGPQL